MPCAAAVSSVTNPPTTLALAIPIIANIQPTSLDIITQWTMSVHYVNAVMGWKIQQTFQNWHFVFFFISEQPKVQRPGWKFCHFLGRILFTMPCIMLSCKDEMPIFKRLLNFSTRYDASSIVTQKGTVFQWHLPKWSMIESRHISFWISRFFSCIIF